MADFYKTLDWFKQLLVYGATFNLSSGIDELDFFIDMLKKYWFRPACELIEELTLYIDGNDLVGKTVSSMPIITDIRA